MISHKALKKKALSKKSVKTEYERLSEEFDWLSELVGARRLAGMTQSEVAKQMGTTTSVIGRLESKNVSKPSPSLSTLERYAKALNCHLEIHVVPNG